MSRSASHSNEANAKLMFGMLYSLKAFVDRISPVPVVKGFRHYTTGSYKLNFLETLSGHKLVLTTDVNVGDTQEDLRNLHKIYVEYALKNPIYVYGDVIDSELFKDKIDSYIRALHYFRAK